MPGTGAHGDLASSPTRRCSSSARLRASPARPFRLSRPVLLASARSTGGYGEPVRDNFVNDIGDYAKYALLRAICAGGEETIRLGVIWYLTEHAERNGDGRKRPHLSQDGWERLDPDLLAAMRGIEGALPSPSALSVSLIQ